MTVAQQTTNLAQLKTTSKMVAREAGIGSVKQFFESQKGTLAAVLPRHVSPDRMLKIALGALRTTPKLMECTVESLMGAVVQCSQLGLEPNTPLGHAYLIPFEKKKKVGGEWVTEKVETQIVIGYKGLIDLARRSGQVVSIAAHAVHEHDHFDYAFGLDEKLEHKPAMSARGRVIAFYAVAKLVGGGHAFEVMSAEQVNEIRDASQNYKFARDKSKTVWAQHYEEMGRKTVLRRLFKYLPVSIELASAAALDDVGASGRSQALDTVLDGDYITPTDDEPDDDGEIDPPSGLTDQRQQQNDMTLPSYDDLLSQIRNAKDEEVLALVLDSARDLPKAEYVKLEQAYQDRREVLLGA
ncbi:recombinase RecT [Burkholderia multivorans]|uniref:recombinase RecT n=1 Tax=Burkholderia multivorans TaxID=87883 RepID=UPI001588C5EE|nr:recombinase RecT [Burkholderia multivorans]MDR9240763.1 Protein RecT [Burkholderia multivorans]MDR9266446.1 Protein RecT [Burkholderia multivorans]MDR9287335.1 Protein RecT [Burkholderia multivorans]MDR9289959.1 Protein RecT [Burkholderia multivorans]MDR9312660.1 Protein RecT [Burkholderia multivorans]